MENENHTIAIEDKIFFNKYKPDKKIGEGSFGKIYLAHNINNGEKFALKLEQRTEKRSLLEIETYILCYLKGDGIPFIKSYGYSGEYNVLVMELLGKSLELLFTENNSKFSLKTVCMLAIQMIQRLQYIHNKHILHRDIKPDNFILGTEKSKNKVYLIDFGLSKKYRSSKGNHEHIKFSDKKRLIGTARYASINALKGCEQGRRDDMEALGYIFMYFLRGNLPWQGLKVSKNEDKYQKIYEKKRDTSVEELCKGFPIQFCEYIKYTKQLKFEEEPNYEYLIGLIETVMKNKKIKNDFLFDWCINEVKGSANTSNNNYKVNVNNFNINNIKMVKKNKKNNDLKNKKYKSKNKSKIKISNKNNNDNIVLLKSVENVNLKNEYIRMSDKVHHFKFDDLLVDSSSEGQENYSNANNHNINFEYFNSNHYKFLTELNSELRQKKNKMQKIIETNNSNVQNNRNIMYEIQEKNTKSVDEKCIIF